MVSEQNDEEKKKRATAEKYKTHTHKKILCIAIELAYENKHNIYSQWV